MVDWLCGSSLISGVATKNIKLSLKERDMSSSQNVPKKPVLGKV